MSAEVQNLYNPYCYMSLLFQFMFLYALKLVSQLFCYELIWPNCFRNKIFNVLIAVKKCSFISWIWIIKILISRLHESYVSPVLLYLCNNNSKDLKVGKKCKSPYMYDFPYSCSYIEWFSDLIKSMIYNSNKQGNLFFWMLV